MAVAENGVASSENHFETTDLERSNGNHISNNVKTEKSCVKSQTFQKNDAVDVVVQEEDEKKSNVSNINGDDFLKKKINGNDDDYSRNLMNSPNSGSDNGGTDDDVNGDHSIKDYNVNDNNNDDANHDYDMKNDEGFKKEMRDLQEMLSKLNPMAKEFVPPSLAKAKTNNNTADNGNFGYVSNFVVQPNTGGNVNGFPGRRRRNGFGQGKRRMNARTSMAQREEVIRRTVYVSDIDQQVTEEQLAGLFINCGQVVDCRICGDPNSMLRFAFVEFTDEESAKAALSLSCTMLGFYPVRVLPSKTAIAPVNPTFLPRSENEREMCARTVYCTNIDKKVTQQEIQAFFQLYCGKVHRLRLLGDYHHSTRIAFVEFAVAESAIMALNCSGAVIGSLPIRVSPSKTPVRPRPPRSPLH